MRPKPRNHVDFDRAVKNNNYVNELQEGIP